MVGVLPGIVIDVDSTVKQSTAISKAYLWDIILINVVLLHIIRSQPFVQRQRKFFKAGFEAEMSIAAIV